MKRLILAIVLICIPITANAWWKSIQQVAVGSPPPSFAITFGSSQEDATGQSTYTISNVGIGSADASRYAVVAVCIRAAGTVTTPTVTIGGAATTKVIEQQTTGSYSGLFQTNAPFPSGTTATVVLSSFGVTAARAAVQGYSVVTSTGTVPSGGAVSAFTPSPSTTTATVTVPSNGASIAAACAASNLTPVSITLPASGTAIDKNAVIGVSATTTFSMHDTATRTGSTTYTFSSSSASWNTSQAATVVGAWAP